MSCEPRLADELRRIAREIEDSDHKHKWDTRDDVELLRQASRKIDDLEARPHDPAIELASIRLETEKVRLETEKMKMQRIEAVDEMSLYKYP